MTPLYVFALLIACTTETETQYPSSEGPMGVGSGGSIETGPEDGDSPTDTGSEDEGDTGTEEPE